MSAPMRHKHLLTFGAAAAAAWALGTLLFLYYWPRIAYNAYEKAILVKGFGSGPVPVNTLYTEPQTLFADPLHTPASGSNLMTTGANRDTLLTVGWLDLSTGPQVLHVPEMAGRYYSVQLTDPSTGVDFAYVGTRTTGTRPGDYLITGPGWTGSLPQGMQQISSPNDAVLVIGRVLVQGDTDLPAAYALAQQIRLAAPGPH